MRLPHERGKTLERDKLCVGGAERPEVGDSELQTEEMAFESMTNEEGLITLRVA